MSDSADVTISGLFKRETKGHTTQPVTLAIERGRIQFFAKSLGDIDPVHSNVEHARAKGHPDLVAPPSFCIVIEALARDAAAARDEQSVIDVIGADFRYLLHGNETYTYEGLIFAGDEVSLTSRVVDFYDKKGGAMEFAVIESLVTHAERGVLIRATRTLLHKLA